MSGPRIAVLVTGNGLPPCGRRWDGYKTAVRELALSRSQSQRNTDRQELKAGTTLSIMGYCIRRCP
jgi:hypothetical protein